MTDDEIEKLANVIRRQGGNSEPPSGARGSESVTDALANPVAKLKQTVDSSIDIWRQSSNIGAGFNNDALGFRTSIMRTGLSVEEYTRVVDSAKGSFTGLGGTVSTGARAFGALTEMYAKDEGAQKLRALGYSAEESDKVLGLVAFNARARDIATKEGQQALLDQSTQLGLEMDRMAQLTGKSRKEQEKKIEADQQDAKFLISQNEETRKYGQKAANAIQGMVAASEMGGTGVRELAKNLSEGGKLSQKSLDTKAAIGDEAFATVQRNLANIREAGRSGDQKRIELAQKQYETELAAALEKRANSDALKNLVLNNDKGVGEAAREFTLGVQGIAKGTKAVADAKGLTDAQAIEANKKNVENAQKGLDAKGDKVAGANLTQGIVEFSQLQRQTNIGLGKIYEALTGKVGSSVIADKTVKEEKNAVLAGGGLVFGPKGAENLANAVSQSNSWGEAGKKIASAAGNLFVERVQAGLGFLKDVAKPESLTTAPGYQKPNAFAEGTMGVFGSLFHKFKPEGELVQVDGEEAIINKKQGEQLFGQINDLQKGMPKTMAGGIDMSQIDSMMNNMLGKASPGGDPKEMIENMANTIQQGMPKEISNPTDSLQMFENLSKNMQKGMPQDMTGMFDSFQKMLPKQPQLQTASGAADRQMTSLAGGLKDITTKVSSANPAPAPAPAPALKPIETAHKATLDDVVKSLDNLNKQMAQLNSHSENIAEHSSKTARATKKFNPDVNMRA